MSRINKDVKRRFERFAILTNSPTVCWERVKLIEKTVNGDKVIEQNRSVIGAIYLDHNSAYGGYNVQKMVSVGGAIKVLNSRRMTAKELIAWFEGYEKCYQDFKNV